MKIINNKRVEPTRTNRHTGSRKCFGRVRRFMQFVTFLGLLACGSKHGMAVNIVLNGDFSAGNTGFTNGYVYVPPAPGSINTEGEYTVGSDPSAFSIYPDWMKFGDHTNGSGNMLIANGSPNPNTSVWTQMVSVSPNTNYVFSFWGATVNTVSGSQTVLQPFINSSAVGSALTLPVLGGTWTQDSVSWFSGANTTALLTIIDTNTVRPWNDFALDDISLSGPSSVPDGGSTAMLLSVSLAGLGWVRRRL
jgi:hypothetical protein